MVHFFCAFFSHPDYTVGPGIPPNPARKLADYNRRLGIAPYPEELLCSFEIKKSRLGTIPSGVCKFTVHQINHNETLLRHYRHASNPSLIQTILSASEFHRILLESSRAITADWELHPTPKDVFIYGLDCSINFFI